jgi:hypothetical protein
MFSDNFRDEVANLDRAKVDPGQVDISLYSMTELLILRNRIDTLLPPMSMAEINLEEELVRQFMTVRALQADTLAGNDEANKKASVVNACASALKALAELQTNVHTAERFKRIENLLIKHIKLLPKEAADAFIEQYSQLVLEMKK